jgi:hypothetical protein
MQARRDAFSYLGGCGYHADEQTVEAITLVYLTLRSSDEELIVHL